MRDEPSHRFSHISYFGVVQIYRSRVYAIEVELTQAFPSRRRRGRGLPSPLGLIGLLPGTGSQR